MSLVVVGVNHNTAPVDLLERLAISEERLPKALHQLSTYEHVLESAVLSTCNRIEVYAAVTKFHGGAQDLRNFLAEFCHVAPEDFVDRLYTYSDDTALRHLFRVAAGIDSMVLGESEILGQVRRAFQAAVEESSAQRALTAAFRKALRVGKRARTETAIGRNPVSISSAAVELARRAFGGDLSGRKIAIVGAGKMGALAATALASAGAADVTVVNRTEERGDELAARFSATSRPLTELPDVLATVDILITSTTASNTVIERPVVEGALTHRSPGTPLFVVDIAVPRDVEPSVRELDGVVLSDIDDLREVVEAGIGSRRSEVQRVEEIIAAEVDSYLEWQRSTEVGPTASALAAWAEAIRSGELARVQDEFQLPADQRAALDAITKQIVSKLLEPPIARATELASSKQGYMYLTALRELFELDDD
ncbi:MAG: glutamyl-tRNA reductase [Actinomycetota bacterium]|nr:glutamyl-tRNA reductase [Actinomycetota bacterium]